MDPTEAVERLWPGRQVRVTALSGGITNHNFRIDIEGDSFVLRMGGADTELLGIDRRIEREANHRAFEVGIAPHVDGFAEPEGWLVTRFIHGQPISLDEMHDPRTIARVATALRRFHEAAPIPGTFDSHAVVVDYRREAEAHGVTIPGVYARALEVSERIRAERGPQPSVPCHNDLLNANFLDDGAIKIVDWEYAGMGDRFFDLANLSVNNEFGPEDDRELMSSYFGAVRDEDLASLQQMKFMSDFREAMWAVLQSGISELDVDFNAYAAKHFERMFSHLA
ncbi:MAG TPA: choline/ethanolamine kinase family protein [Candidatus Dormibacteraeota bacterium]|nr:choline/ethanolamine kinase family protein [Candidatus Dormibacteraeota bacterium]